jgi:hypothetical protein
MEAACLTKRSDRLPDQALGLEGGKLVNRSDFEAEIPAIPYSSQEFSTEFFECQLGATTTSLQEYPARLTPNA